MTDSFLKEGIISDEDKEIVRFGLESMEGNLQGIGLTLVVGICCNRVGEALLLWLLLFPLRKNAGGYHAATKKRCLFMSVVMLIIAFIVFGVYEHMLVFYGICVVIAGCVIWFLAPIANPSKELDAVEYKVYRRRTRIVERRDCYEKDKEICSNYFIVGHDAGLLRDLFCSRTACAGS